MAGGVYANRLVVWHTGHEFTLDFMVPSQPPQPAQGPHGPVIGARHRIVTRVRIPPTALFEIVRALSELSKYEARFGSIKAPGQEPPLYPPDGLGDTGPNAA